MADAGNVVPTTPPVRVEMEWQGEQRFRGGRPGEPQLVLDGRRTTAPGPVDTLVLALCACSAIDVVEILTKRRTPPRSLRVSAEFTRVDGTPRRLRTVRLLYSVDTDSDLEHVQRAATLSLEKYCSVSGSLAPDVEITTAVELIAQP